MSNPTAAIASMTGPETTGCMGILHAALNSCRHVSTWRREASFSCVAAPRCAYRSPSGVVEVAADRSVPDSSGVRRSPRGLAPQGISAAPASRRLLDVVLTDGVGLENGVPAVYPWLMPSSIPPLRRAFPNQMLQIG